MLTDLKRYLTGRNRASLTEISTSLSADPDAVRPMLEHWMRKGRVRKVGSISRCGGCVSCNAADLELYEWTRPASSE